MRKAMLHLLVGVKPFNTNLTTSALTEKQLRSKSSENRQEIKISREVASKVSCHSLTQHKDNREPMGKSQLQSWSEVRLWLVAEGNNPEVVVCSRTLNTLKEFFVFIFTSSDSRKTSRDLFITVNTVKIYLCINVTLVMVYQSPASLKNCTCHGSLI